MELTVVCVLVKGHVGFTPEYVTRLWSMCSRVLPKHRFVCFTDNPGSLPSFIEKVKIPTPRGIFAWWAKLELFNPVRDFNGRLLYLDLDVLLVGDVNKIVEFNSTFALVPDGAPGFKPAQGKKCVKKFNSSVMVWDAEHTPHHVFTEWNRAVADRLWGDQDWLGEQIPSADIMPLEWFPRLSAVGNKWDSDAKVLLCKKPKNHIAAQQSKWFSEAWQ